MASIQRIKLVNKKEFLGHDGMVGFNADIKHGNTTIGTISDYANGSITFDISIYPEFRERYNDAIDTFHNVEMGKEDSLYQGFYAFYWKNKEYAFLELLLFLMDIEKTAKKHFKDGKYYYALVNYPIIPEGDTETLMKTHLGINYDLAFEPYRENAVDKYLETFEGQYTHVLKFRTTKDFKIMA